MSTTTAKTTARIMLNKVPEVTVYFWLIKILCTTVGESFADYINETLGFGLTNTTILFGAAFAVTLGVPRWPALQAAVLGAVAWLGFIALVGEQGVPRPRRAGRGLEVAPHPARQRGGVLLQEVVGLVVAPRGGTLEQAAMAHVTKEPAKEEVAV